MRTLTLTSLTLLTACGGSGFGLTPGGVQDMGLAREIIESGGIPSRAQFTSEGLFSEHDLPFDGAAACEDLLCPRVGTVDVDPIDGSGPQVLAQVGFDTSIAEVKRDPLALALVVDVSGSMAGEKMQSVKQALLELVPKLGPEDEVSLVAFDNRSKVLLKLTSMNDRGKDKLREQIRDLRDSGGTNIEAGLVDGYETLERAEKKPWLMLFTDAQPNVGMTGPDSFEGLVRSHQDEVGLSVFGVGQDLGAELFELISETRNASGRTLFSAEDIAHVFDDLDLMVTPIAHDLELSVQTSEGVVEARAFGAPSASDDGLVVGAATLFLSRNAGGIGVLLEAQDAPELGEEEDVLAMLPSTLGTLHLAWTPIGGERQETSVGVLRETEPAHTGPVKMAGLVDEILALEAGAALCEGALTVEEAGARVEAAEARLRLLAGDLKDAPLQAEAELMAMLRGNLDSGDCR